MKNKAVNIMIQRTKSGRIKKRAALKLSAAAMIIVGLMLLVDMRVRPIIEKTSVYQSRIVATRIINEAIFEEISDEYFDYEKLVNVVYGGDNRVSSVESNMVNINRLKTQVTENINEALKNIEES